MCRSHWHNKYTAMIPTQIYTQGNTKLHLENERRLQQLNFESGITSYFSHEGFLWGAEPTDSEALSHLGRNTVYVTVPGLVRVSWQVSNEQQLCFRALVVLVLVDFFFGKAGGRLSCQSRPPTFLNRSSLVEMLLQREQHHYPSTGVGGESWAGEGVNANGYARKGMLGINLTAY